MMAISRLEGVLFWRGIPERDWRLDSTMVRRLRQKDRAGGLTERSVRYWETNLLQRARHRGFDIVGGGRLGDFELLALLRHHGAATRLVDFSRSVVVALWFAAFELPQSSGRLLGVHTEGVSGYEGEPIESDYGAVMQWSERADLLTWSPPGLSPRIAAQHSQFLFSRTEECGIGTLLLPYDDPTRVVALDFSPDLKPEILKFLRSALDIGTQTMFPDLPGFADAYSVDPVENPHRW